MIIVFIGIFVALTLLILNYILKKNIREELTNAVNANIPETSCTIKIDGKCFGTPFIPTPLTREECKAQGLICYYDNDYWAGAVKQCGGINKLPTMSDLGKLASALYIGKPTVGAKQDISNLTYISGTAASIGLPEPDFNLWSSEEYINNTAYLRIFGQERSYWYYNTRTNRSIQAVCLK